MTGSMIIEIHKILLHFKLGTMLVNSTIYR